VSALSSLAAALAAAPGRAGVQAVLAVALVVLLCERELLRLAGGRRARVIGPALDAALAPLLGVFGLMLVVRLVELL
jgi:hypothetical protein